MDGIVLGAFVKDVEEGCIPAFRKLTNETKGFYVFVRRASNKVQVKMVEKNRVG